MIKPPAHKALLTQDCVCYWLVLDMTCKNDFVHKVNEHFKHCAEFTSKCTDLPYIGLFSKDITRSR